MTPPGGREGRGREGKQRQKIFAFLVKLKEKQKQLSERSSYVDL